MTTIGSVLGGGSSVGGIAVGEASVGEGTGVLEGKGRVGTGVAGSVGEGVFVGSVTGVFKAVGRRVSVATAVGGRVAVETRDAVCVKVANRVPVGVWVISVRVAWGVVVDGSVSSGGSTM